MGELLFYLLQQKFRLAFIFEKGQFELVKIVYFKNKTIFFFLIFQVWCDESKINLKIVEFVDNKIP